MKFQFHLNHFLFHCAHHFSYPNMGMDKIRNEMSTLIVNCAYQTWLMVGSAQRCSRISKLLGSTLGNRRPYLKNSSCYSMWLIFE